MFFVNLADRLLRFWGQVWQYLCITFIWASLLQMYSLSYSLNSNKSNVPNAIFCIFCMVLCLAIPIVIFIYTHRQYYKIDYFSYFYRYGHIFILQLPQNQLPSSQHQINILISSLRYILLCIFISYLSNYYLQALILIIVVHLLYFIYEIFAKIQKNMIVKICTAV